MGIPQYFKYVRTRHPSVMTEINVSETKKNNNSFGDDGGGARETRRPASASCANLLLDFNCAVHKCARIVLDRLRLFPSSPSPPPTGNGEGNGFSRSALTTAELEAMIIEEACDFVDAMVRFVRPSDTVFIAIDGVPPCAKMVQQRSRRYLAHWVRGKLAAAKRSAALRHSPQPAGDGNTLVDPESLWDSGCITPGTAFMTTLSRRLHQRFDKKGPPANWGVSRVWISDSNTPREGEQKIFRALRDRAFRGTSFIYGLDADLLVLSALCLEIDSDLRLCVLRPADGSAPPGQHDETYYVVDMTAFRSIVHTQMATDDITVSTRDYAVLCSLLGNDFIPGLACLPVSNAAIQTLVGAYKKFARDPHRQTTRRLSWVENDNVNDNDASRVRINYAFLNDIVESVAETEDARMAAVDRDYYTQALDCQRRAKICDKRLTHVPQRTAPPQQQPPKNGVAFSEKRHHDDAVADKYPLMLPFPDVVRPHESGWRLRYYHYLLGDANVVRDACTNYVEGIEWSINYHGQRPIDVAWRYKFAYAPTALDLANFMAVDVDGLAARMAASRRPRNLTEQDSLLSATVTPEMQLMMVLPPASVRKFLSHRPQLLRMLTDVDHGCTHLYPTDFRVLTYLKRYTSECCPVLPDIDYEEVVRTAASCLGLTRKPRTPRPLRSFSSCDAASPRRLGR